jgi:hypothetical protein
MAAALIDRLRYPCQIVITRGASYRMRQHRKLFQALSLHLNVGPPPIRRALHGPPSAPCGVGIAVPILSMSVSGIGNWNDPDSSPTA